jgi:hypothetical protein
MTQQRDIERLLDLWFSDGPTESPDRVVDVVADRIERQPQRPAWRFHLREIHVNTMLRAGIAVAAVVVVAFIAVNLLPGQSTGTGGTAPSPSSSVTHPPSAAPSPSGSAAACADAQSCPPFPAGPATSTAFTPRLSYTAPAGYTQFSDVPQAYGVAAADGSGAGFFIFRDPSLATNDNACEGDPNLGVKALSADTVSSAFTADQRLQVTTPTAVTIGPYSGKSFDLQLAPTWTGTCPWSNGQPGALVLTVRSGVTPTSPSYGMAAGDPPLRIYLLDVGGSPIWIQVPQSAADQVLPVLQTLSFTP